MRDPARVEADRPGPEGDAGPRVHPIVRTHRGRPRESLPRVARRQHQQLRCDQTAVRREAHGPGEVRGALPPGPGFRRPDPDDDGRRHLPDEGEGSRRGREAPRLRVLRWTMPVAGLLEQTVEIPGGVEVGLDGEAASVAETKVEVTGDQGRHSGPDVEGVGQPAANIELPPRIRGDDPRIFQDGIYITEKAGKEAGEWRTRTRRRRRR